MNIKSTKTTILAEFYTVKIHSIIVFKLHTAMRDRLRLIASQKFLELDYFSSILKRLLGKRFGESFGEEFWKVKKTGAFRLPFSHNPKNGLHVFDDRVTKL